jgi:hypothetical protein
MGAKSHDLDNTVAESFLTTLEKNQLHRTSFATRQTPIENKTGGGPDWCARLSAACSFDVYAAASIVITSSGSAAALGKRVANCSPIRACC